MILNKGQHLGLKEVLWAFALLGGTMVLFLGAFRVTARTTEGCSRYIRRSGIDPKACIGSDRCRLVASSSPLSPEGENKNYYVRCKTAVHSHEISCADEDPDHNCPGAGSNCVDARSSKDYGTCVDGNNYYMCSLD